MKLVELVGNRFNFHLCDIAKAWSDAVQRVSSRPQSIRALSPGQLIRIDSRALRRLFKILRSHRKSISSLLELLLMASKYLYVKTGHDS